MRVREDVFESNALRFAGGLRLPVRVRDVDRTPEKRIRVACVGRDKRRAVPRFNAICFSQNDQFGEGQPLDS